MKLARLLLIISVLLSLVRSTWAQNSVPSTSVSTISTANSTTTALNSGQTFTGTGEDVSNFSTVSIIIFSDMTPGGVATVHADWSSDNTNWDYTESFTVVNAAGQYREWSVKGQYFRLRITQAVQNETDLRAQVVYHQTTVEKGGSTTDPLYVIGPTTMSTTFNAPNTIIETEAINYAFDGSVYRRVLSDTSGNFSIVGTKTNNNAAPGANNVGVLPALSNTSAPSYSDGNQAALSVDTSGSLRATITNTPTVTANAGTGTFTVAGGKTDNNAAPGATNVGVLPGVANAAAPTRTEGDQVALSTDLLGRLRTTHKYVTVTASYTRQANTTAYAVNDILTNSGSSGATYLTFSGCAAVNGGSGVIHGFFIVDEANQSTKPAFNLILFNNTVTLPADNAAANLSNSDVEKFVAAAGVGVNDWTTTNSGSGASGNLVTTGVFGPNPGFNYAAVPFTCSGSTTNLYGALQMANAYTPISGEKITVGLVIEQAE